MNTDYFDRIRKEFTLSMTALREGVMAVSERVTRKVQVLTLHWRASQLSRDMQQHYQELGRHVAACSAAKGQPVTGSVADLDKQLAVMTSRVGLLKKELVQVDSVVRELATESLGETLLSLQRDLSTRAATLERLVVGTDSPVVGCSLRQLALGPAVWVVAIIRGPALLTPIDQLVIRAGDVVLMLGQRTDLAKVLAAWQERHRESA